MEFPTTKKAYISICPKKVNEANRSFEIAVITAAVLMMIAVLVFKDMRINTVSKVATFFVILIATVIYLLIKVGRDHDRQYAVTQRKKKEIKPIYFFGQAINNEHDLIRLYMTNPTDDQRILQLISGPSCWGFDQKEHCFKQGKFKWCAEHQKIETGKWIKSKDGNYIFRPEKLNQNQKMVRHQKVHITDLVEAMA